MPWYNHAPTFADPDTGAFSEDFKGIVGNFPAMAAGEPGAPKIEGPAVSLLAAKFTVNPTSNVVIADLDRVKHISIRMAAGSGATGSVFIDFSNDNGASFGADLFVYSASGIHVFSGEVVIDLASGDYIIMGTAAGPSIGNIIVNANGTHTMPANCNAIRITSGGPTFNGVAVMLGGVA